MIINDYQYDVRDKKVFNGILIKDQNTVFAVVDLTSKDNVWIRKDLDSKRKLRLAAISTALLLRPNLQNVN